MTTAGVAAGLASINPFLGLMVGIATSVGMDQGLKYGARRIQENVQDAIAEAAGPLNIGQSATWQVAETLPLTERVGTVEDFKRSSPGDGGKATQACRLTSAGLNP